jgi:23S rRNA (uracil1939-C5)-methyltransferase
VNDVVCPVALECGGCPQIQLTLRAQRQHKQAGVCAALARAEIEFPEPEWGDQGSAFGYRNRLRLRVRDDGRVAFFNEHKAAGCAVLERGLKRQIVRLRAFAERRPELMQPFAHLEVRAPDADGRSGVCFYAKPAAAPPDDAARAALAELGDQVLVGTNSDIPDRLARQRWQLADDVYAWVPLDGFMQVNTLVNRALLGRLRSLARAHAVRSFADLYAGAGNLSLPLLRDGLYGRTVELQPSAVSAFRTSCAEQGLTRAESVSAPAEAAALSCVQEGACFDLLILDPPRAGVRRGLSRMLELARRYVAVCSCNPETLARDLKTLVSAGFALKELLLFDMFPQTRHVETLAWLERR